MLAVGVNYPKMGADALGRNPWILVDSGLIRLEVLSSSPARGAPAEVVVPALLTSRRHINLPGVRVRLPALTAKDRADIAVGVEEQGRLLCAIASCARRTTSTSV